MIVLTVLVILALIALAIVSIVNNIQEKEQQRRLQQRKLKVQAESLSDLVTCLEQTVPNRMIAKYINDEIILLLQHILRLETAPAPHIENSIHHAQLRSEELISAKHHTVTSYQKDSDVQITQTQLQLDDAGKVIRHLCAQGKISGSETELIMSELSWAYLMTSVASYIGQGYKFTALQDRFSAQSFYQKGQNLLMESMHPDPRRLRMIKELGEVIEGSRKTISRDLLPERPIPL